MKENIQINKKSAFIAIVGRPNVGKSSLLNNILGKKVAIVSPKPQTTRNRIMGILTEGDTQFVFIDTPGMHLPKTRLGTIMVKAIADSVKDIDLAVLVVEPKEKLMPAEQELIGKFKARKIPAILAINKIDKLSKKDELLKTIAAFKDAYEFDAVVPLSALTGENTDVFMKEIAKFALPSPFFFDEDTWTDQPEKVIAAEIIREKFLKLLQKEIPHGIAVLIEKLAEREEQEILDIEAIIYCERESHKSIVIGKKGEMLKTAATQARVDMEDFFGCKVNLKCWVKVKEDWRNRQGTIHNLGLS